MSTVDRKVTGGSSQDDMEDSPSQRDDTLAEIDHAHPLEGIQYPGMNGEVTVLFVRVCW